MSTELPVILVVEHADGGLKELSKVLESFYRVVTCPVERIALEYVSETRPAAVLLNANSFYLDGPGVADRWRSVASSTRVLFLDADGPWMLLMELDESESGQVAIAPCTVEGLASAVTDLLGRAVRGMRECEDGRMAVVAV